MTDIVTKAHAVLDPLATDPSLYNVERYREWLGDDGPRELLAEVERLRAEVDELTVDRDTGFRDRMAQHDREQMRRERDQARAVVAKVEAVIESPYWGTHWGEVMVPQPRLREALRGEGE